MPNKTKILLIDPSRENIKTLCEIIASPDVEIFSFTSLEEAIATLATQDYGLAILDMKLPAIGDVEQMKVIRAKQHDHLPIVFVTDQQNNDQTVLQGYETGAIDLLFRPLNPYIVRSKVRVFVELHKQRREMQFHMKEVEELRIAAEAATLAKSQFLANMSHEIRTPLAAVMGFADLIARGSVSPQEMEECSSSIHRNGSLLMRIIDDILDLSKIEANRIEMELRPNLLEEVLNEIDSTLSLKAREKSLQLYFSRNAEAASQHYKFDPVRMKQILLNIIGNAIKFTNKPNGQVLVNMQTGKVSQTHDRITFNVKNEGVGFSALQASRLFQPFGQADTSIKREYGGSGLGLVISRQLARAMGGDIIVLQSEINVGTEFEITIVLERAHKSAVQIVQRPVPVVSTEKPLKDTKILIVDDSRDNLVLLEMFLRGSEAYLTLASNGLEAYELCKNNKFDMILMDIQMPKMDGHEATKAIRLLGQNMPIIALTAHGTKNEYEKSRLAGCNESITKPFSQPNLLKILASYIQH